jgi:hypothetical protein
MFNALRMSDPGVQAARRHEAIIGKKVMARGCFSAVFDNGNTVHKLTLDKQAYAMACDGVMALSGEHFTQVVADHGQVGEVLGESLYLFECEKLEKLPKGGPLRALARKIATRATTHASYHMNMRNFNRADTRQALCMAFEELSQDEGLPDSLQLAFGQLRDFAYLTDDGWSLDIHSANLMVRPADGTLVISDPIADMKTQHALSAARYKHQFD